MCRSDIPVSASLYRQLIICGIFTRSEYVLLFICKINQILQPQKATLFCAKEAAITDTPPPPENVPQLSASADQVGGVGEVLEQKQLAVM